MEVSSRVCEDEVLPVESRGSNAQFKRILPGFCGLTLLGAAGLGGRSVWTSTQFDKAISMPGGYNGPWPASHYDHHSHDYYVDAWGSHPEEWWRSFPDRFDRTDDQGCSWDGHDCMETRCCAREGSRCFQKDSLYAACNETCLSFTKWEGSWHHGKWVHTHTPHWDCNDITQDPPPADPNQRRLHSAPNPRQIPPGLYPPPVAFWPSHEYYKAAVYGGCQEDGLDCRYSRCCAREGSRCYVKNSRWASCNETCISYTQWEGSHRHGHWQRTNHPVWDCTDITDA